MSSSTVLTLKVKTCPNAALAVTNCVYLNPADCPKLTLEVQSVALPLKTYLILKNRVFVFAPSDLIPVGCIAMTAIQRTESDLALDQSVEVRPYNPEREDIFLTSMNVEVDLLAKVKSTKDNKKVEGPRFSAVQLAATIERSFLKQIGRAHV